MITTEHSAKIKKESWAKKASISLRTMTYRLINITIVPITDFMCASGKVPSLTYYNTKKTKKILQYR